MRTLQKTVLDVIRIVSPTGIEPTSIVLNGGGFLVVLKGKWLDHYTTITLSIANH
jgi:hypothetical protein